MNAIILSCFALLIVLNPSTATAQQAATVIDSNINTVKLVPVDVLGSKGIPFLKWTTDQFVLDQDVAESSVKLTGVFGEKVKSATINGKLLNVGNDGSFVHEVKYTGEQKALIVTAVDEKGAPYRVNFKLSGRASNQLVLKIGSEKATAISRWRYSLGAGYTLINYRDFTDIAFEQRAITVKGGVVYRAVESVFDVGLSAFYNLVPLNTVMIQGNGIHLQYIGVNLRGTYHLVESPSPLRVNVSGGLYWNSSNSVVGFKNMYGPQIAPDFTYVFDNGHSLYLYGKYAFSVSGSTGISIKDNREVATGLHYSFPVSMSNRMTIGTDVSQLSLSIGNSWASTNTYSLSAGLSF